MVDKGILVEFAGVTRQADLAIEVLDFPTGSNEWLIAADVMDGDVALTPNQMNWYYSDAVDRSFVYVPNDYNGGLLKMKELVTSANFNRLHLSLVRVPWAKGELDTKSPPRIVRCRYAANRVSLSLHNSTVESIRLLGEINR